MQAFWEVLEEKPYAQMTVSDIARAANVRRNTFYYHYANVGELAEQAIRQYIPLAVQNINVMRSGGPDSHFPPLFPPDAQGKIALIAGPHGAMDLLNIVKNIAWDLWVSEFGVDESKRPPVRIRYQRHDGRQLVPDALRSRAKSRIACEQRSAGHHVRNPSADLPDHPLLAYANSARAATNAADASTLPAMMAHAAGRAQLTVQPTPKRSGRNRLASSGLQ